MKCVKFCGIRRDEDVTFVNELLPEYIGLIFYEKAIEMSQNSVQNR